MIPQPSNLAELRAIWRVTLADSQRWYRPTWSMVAGDTPKLYVNGVIGGYESDAAEFVKAVHAIDAEAIDLHINSPGGFVWDTVSMYEALRSHPATVHTHVDGVAASAASFLALAGDTVDTAKGSRWMVHDAQIVAMGSPAQVREYADLGDAISNDIAGIYADRAGGKAAAWRAAMTATTWYSAEQAVGAGLADRVSGTDTKTSGASNLAARTLRARAAVALGRAS